MQKRRLGRSGLEIWVPAAALLLVAACGGGGGGGGGGSSSTPPTGWQAGVFKPASSFVAQCANPRTGTDPSTNKPYADTRGTLLDENNWLRSWSNDLYLWYSEITDRDPSLYASTDAYFSVLRTTAVTASGASKDRFHFTYPTEQWYTLSTTGSEAGYGADWEIVEGRPPRSVLVGYTAPGSPADVAGIVRGTSILQVDGRDVVNTNVQGDIDVINAGLFPGGAGENHTFQVQDPGAGPIHTITLVSADVTMPSVQNVTTLPTGSGLVGYLQFNDHLAAAESAVVAAFATLKNANVSDLVLDIRYNGGGYLDIASEVAYMIAGQVNTAGQTFELTQFNAKHPNTDPVTGRTITPVLFHDTSLGFSPTLLAAGQALPTLNLARVFVLTGPGTCSASESIINGLRGVGLQVIQVGSTTCGKPYGFYPEDNCGTTYFSIEFRGVNAQSFGDYPDGFSPQNEPAASNGGFVGVSLPGCSVGDDFAHALGNPEEARLAAALAYRSNGGNCPVPATGLGLRRQLAVSASEGGLPLVRPAPVLRQLRLLGRDLTPVE